VSGEKPVRDSQSVGRPTAWLEDQFVEAYVSWREACADVEGAYALLDRSRRNDRGLALAAFDAALDREEAASRAYGDAVDRLSSSADHARMVAP
jgi:hypothetical protein